MILVFNKKYLFVAGSKNYNEHKEATQTAQASHYRYELVEGIHHVSHGLLVLVGGPYEQCHN